MPIFFPRHSVEWRLEEPAAFRRLSLSLVEMALITGVSLRLFRAIVLGSGAPASMLLVVGSFALGAVFLFGMTAAHLANFPIQRWLWRAPAFALLVAASELATSLLLIQLGREFVGTARATFADWPSLVASVLATRSLGIVLFALVLAAVVQGVRRLLLRRGSGDPLDAPPDTASGIARR
jgi:hypothetical protein